ncbi:pentatricopeptide repeat-containing protein At3g26782, mitochondrial [Selaginella moellendorffii]|uniref:pentatricopeptide repeat-containing protein At3g26782, mitochondrial n=1 Tax=Selaginella moellendorffii TaxID=88036 RepID=UPI000D1C5A7D|nr:pentatricopeptide repeat-containing protein At3g26782, mitochondrial [Selaginella moellendorffii]XP_024529453.1 pentatricopeptide repeat-containing protein At3g26782, mitochondrial [Selaginella moellendorffii]|eukprot:XP_024529452.1 pentatricopeptide repeat-containing protein At3g26782, mitochondrial [Selaginella moellendorffii]
MVLHPGLNCSCFPTTSSSFSDSTQAPGRFSPAPSCVYVNSRPAVKQDNHSSSSSRLEAGLERYPPLLRQCGAARDLSQARRLHVEIIENGLDRERFLGNLLVQAYGKCGSLQDARTVFDGMVDRNLYSWTLLIGAYAQNGFHREALDLFWAMDRQPDNVTFLTVLCSCSSCGDVVEGRALHERIRCSRFERDTMVGNALISMYGKCDSLVDARSVFESMDWRQRNVVSWNAMIAAYAQNGHSTEALVLYWRMNLQGLGTDHVTFVSVLGACSSLAQGREIHNRVFYSGLDSFQSLANALVTMYARFGSVGDAKRMFQSLQTRDETSWNAVILAHSQSGDWSGALRIFKEMKCDVKPNSTTYINVISGFSTPEVLPEGRKIHAEIVANGFDTDLVVATALINMYGKCGSSHEAREVFDKMKKRDMVSWNVMIGCYVLNGDFHEALELYQKLDMEGFKRTKATFVSILGACSSVKALAQGRLVHSHILERGLDSEVAVATALVNMYAKCGSLEEARKVFNAMKNRDAVAWSTLIGAYASNGYGKDARSLYEGMVREELKPDNVTFMSLLGACSSFEECSWVDSEIVKNGFEKDAVVGTTLLNTYGKHGKVEEARKVFDRLGSRDTISWNAMITTYVQNGCAVAAMKIFREMTGAAGLKPDAVTFIAVLEACASLGRLSEVKALHAQISESELESNVVVTNTLINMYARCGSLEEAERLFAAAKEKTVVSWTAMVAAFSQYGRYAEALDLFQEMDLEGVKPDDVTYTSILFVCTHGGSLEQGWRYFTDMAELHALAPTADHFAAMVDLLGRSGRLFDAKELLESMPFEPDPVAWMTFLTACRIHGKLELGEAAAERVYELDPSSTAPYIAMSNIYAAHGMWEKVASVRKKMEERGLKKLPGLSFIEVDGKLHEFSSGGKYHPRTDEICEELTRLHGLMRAAGYVPDTKAVLHDVSEGEKETMLLYHSEKMAIAFGLVSSRGSGEPIRVVKNLRVCSDCHTATKFIARIAGRDIIVRDCNRFHRFSSDGKCSCGDYW